VYIKDFLYWAIEFSVKEKGKSVHKESKYFAERFNEFVLGHGKELFLVGEAAPEYENTPEHKNVPIKLIDWIVDSSQDDKTSLVKFMNWLTPAKEKGSILEDFKYLADHFQEFVLNHGKELLSVCEAAILANSTRTSPSSPNMPSAEAN